ncbi:MAG: phosphoribosylglycinamide formyltransferase [Phycisphaerae bacterium]|jgi:phosphoribosylglycinamide formyltransferase-1|nr:phosphoribosylglycinamide formyltransferase [Phycisphaerae bacterium]
MNQLSIVVFASGRGRTLQNLLERIQKESLPLEVRALVVHRACAAEQIATSHGLPVHRIDAEDHEGCHQVLQSLAPDLAVLAGWIRPFPAPSPIPAINIHPSLLPKFGGKGMYGKHVHAAVVAAKEKVSGCTIHVVTEQYDQGPVLAQMEVSLEAGDSAEIVGNRVFEAECELLPNTLVALASGQISITEMKRGIR